MPLLQNKSIPTIIFIMRIQALLQSNPEARERAEQELPGIKEEMEEVLEGLFNILSEEERDRLLEAFPLKKRLPKTEG